MHGAASTFFHTSFFCTFSQSKCHNSLSDVCKFVHRDSCKSHSVGSRSTNCNTCQGSSCWSSENAQVVVPNSKLREANSRRTYPSCPLDAHTLITHSARSTIVPPFISITITLTQPISLPNVGCTTVPARSCFSGSSAGDDTDTVVVKREERIENYKINYKIMKKEGGKILCDCVTIGIIHNSRFTYKYAKFQHEMHSRQVDKFN